MSSSGKENLSGPSITMNTNEFMLQLHKRLLEKTYGTPPRQMGENTASAYIKTLYTLNEKKAFKNLAFLKKTDDIMKKLGEYAESTQKTLLASITSVLSLDKDKAGYKKVYKFFYDKMMERSKAAKDVDTSEKTTKQEDNWIEWDEVIKKYNEMKTKTLNEKKPEWEHLLDLLVLALYTEIPPRRNQDYLHMNIVRTSKGKGGINTADLTVDKNYLVLGARDVPIEFIFNVYKTAKTYGQQTMPIPAPLATVIKKYILSHPLAADKKTKTFPMLVLADAVPITADNAITRILNRIFGKKVGSSMLRHIYLSSKYNITAMSEDSEAMGHSVSQQKEYLKAPTVEVPPMLEG